MQYIFVFGGKKVSEGASDNLSGCYTALALMRTLKDNGAATESTELTVVVTGAEECGMRGAAAWCKAHADEDKSGTVVIALDTLREADKFAVSLRELNGLVGTDAALAEALTDAAGAAGIICEKLSPHSARQRRRRQCGSNRGRAPRARRISRPRRQRLNDR